MRCSPVLFLGVLAAAALLAPVSAEACSCLPPDLARSYNGADAVFTAEVTGPAASPSPMQVRFQATVRKVYKGCLEPGDAIVLQTASSSAACGIGLSVGQTYYLNGYAVGGAGGAPVLAVNLCDMNKPAGDLTADDLAFLRTRTRICGDKVYCEAGMVHCLVDPCRFSTCDAPGATCVSNYCGGCFAEWYDAAGARVCTGSCEADADCPAGSWCRPLQAGGKACAPFAGPGDSCGGYTMIWAQERCEPGLLCVPREPTGDLPGTCAACEYDGQPYQVGDTFPAGDGCNTCFCAESFVGCTLMLCPPKCDYEKTDRSYVSKDPKVCERIRWLCLEGLQPFSDECGCGCEPARAAY
ncbi:MAG: hypothetical protein R3325_11785 [Thermoanaerobaculia bacterium]|nr:hypothetical protein [Thermoanaerobaculia bacterium]